MQLIATYFEIALISYAMYILLMNGFREFITINFYQQKLKKLVSYALINLFTISIGDQRLISQEPNSMQAQILFFFAETWLKSDTESINLIEYNKKMGNNNIGKITSGITSLTHSTSPPLEPVPTSLQVIKSDISNLNKLLVKKQINLQILLALKPESIVILPSLKWEDNLVPGTISIITETKPDISYYQKQYNIALSIQQSYQMYRLIKNYDTSSQKRLSRESRQEDNKLCVICFNARPTQVLPCAHAFCEDCMQKYIVDKQEKVCPLCRTQYHQSLSHDIYNIVQYDDEMEEEMRKMFYGILMKRNSREVHQVKKIRKLITEQASLDQKQEYEEKEHPLQSPNSAQSHKQEEQKMNSNFKH